MTTRNLLFSSLILSSLFIACGDDKDGHNGDGDGDASGGSVNGDGDGDASGGSNGKPSGGSSGTPSGGSSGTPSGGSNGNPSGGSDSEGSGGKGSGGDGEGGVAGDGDGDGEGGQGGAANSCDETGDFPTFNVQARSNESWAENDFDDVTITEDECGIATLAIEWPHETGWEGADPGEANMEATKFSLEFPYTQDLTGKRLTLKMRQKENGRGTSATNGGIDVYLGAQDRSGYTEFFTPYEAGKENQPGYWGGAYNDGDLINLTLDIDDAGPDFDPTDVFKIFVRISNKFWGDGSDPVFDYEITELELISLTVTDAP